MRKMEEIRQLWKPFLIIFFISFLILNWNNISWIFNYRVISQTIANFFQKDNSLKSGVSETIEFEYSEKENSLEIPKVEVSAPLIFVEDIDEVHKTLDKGVVHFPDSVLPGEKGQTIILGHSAPPNWPDINYDNVFSRLNELEGEDEIFVYFNHQKYNYSVIKKIFLERGEEIPENTLTNSDNMLILISCWPPGKDIRRIAVEAKLKIE